MITAAEARENVKMHTEFVYTETKRRLDPVIDEIDRIIQFDSKMGKTTTEIKPYTVSHFSSLEMMVCAQQLLTSILSQNGYTIITNDFSKNILKIQW